MFPYKPGPCVGGLPSSSLGLPRPADLLQPSIHPQHLVHSNSWLLDAFLFPSLTRSQVDRGGVWLVPCGIQSEGFSHCQGNEFCKGLKRGAEDLHVMCLGVTTPSG